MNVMQINDAFGTFGASIIVAQPLLDKKDAFKTFMRKRRSHINEFPSDSTEDLRTYMSERCFRGDIPRFAVKKIRDDLDEEMTGDAIVDLAVEAKFLACIDHSNIIRLWATVGIPGRPDFMIVLDRLVSVLDKKVEEWKEQEKSSRSPFKRLMVSNREKRRSQLHERLLAMFDIARALRHLHKHRYVLPGLRLLIYKLYDSYYPPRRMLLSSILFRDLKPE
jgi:serine/threonine protein kinase